MKSRFACLSAVLYLFTTAACVHNKDITCTDGAIEVRPVGFKQSDFDSAKVIKYKQDNTFSTIVDSTSKTFYTTGERYDTAEFYSYTTSRADSMHPYFITPGYDYQVILPAIGRTFSITNIVQSGQTHQSISTGLFDDKFYICYNSIMHLVVDGNTFSGTADKPGIAVEIVK